MKRPVLLALVIVLLVSCAGSGTQQPPTWTPEAPKKVQMTIEVAPTSTATDEPTFTPIPATFTLTATSTNTPTSTSTTKPTATKAKPAGIAA